MAEKGREGEVGNCGGGTGDGRCVGFWVWLEVGRGVGKDLDIWNDKLEVVSVGLWVGDLRCMSMG